MSVRLLTTRLVKHGRYFIQSYWRRDIHANILEQNQKIRSRFAKPATIWQVQGNVINSAKNATVTPRAGIFRVGQHARKLFIDNLLSRVTTTYSEQLRSQATKKLFYGDSAPFFALVGVSLASGAGVLTKEDELEGVCYEIREAATRLQSSWNKEYISENLDTDFNIDKLNIGPPIAKGCAAVVYAASFKGQQSSEMQMNMQDDKIVNSVNDADITNLNQSPLHLNTQSLYPAVMSPIQNMSRFVHNFGGSVDNLNTYSQSSSAAAFVEDFLAREEEKLENKTEEKPMNTNNETTAAFSGNSSRMQGMQHLNTSNASIDRYPLALKMMFNYDIQSNALSILRAMYKETVPARQRYMNESSAEWERLIQDQTLILPPHPNIVCMFGFFCDEVRNFPDGHLLYPIAQPQRINPYGYGRNMSLYLLMKRYDNSLRGLLDTEKLSMRTKVLLFTQLLEAVAHINRHGIAHRDIKSDNILIEMNDDKSAPVLVLSDFGCCLSDKVHGLQIPYNSFDIDKGGNAALMAPEIINKVPGSFAVLNYAKADLWACGAIAYEIFGLSNPFYSLTGGLAAENGQNTHSLRNSDYKEEDLPPFTDECPLIVKQLVQNILNPNPSKRVSPDIAANVLQLYLWAPSNWLKSGGMPNSPEILQWLLSLTTKLMCEFRTPISQKFNYSQNGRRTYVEYLLICSFLGRARLRRIRGALNWIQNVI